MQPASSQASTPAANCPVCGAKFRGLLECPRCRTDLSELMRIAVRAWVARRHACEALRVGDLSGALRWSARARQLQNRVSPLVR